MALTSRWALLARLGSAANSATSLPRPISLTAARLGKVVPYKLADIGEGIREVVVKEWFVKPGDRVSQFDQICEVQSDKASVTISSRYDGTVQSLRCQVEQTILVGEPFIDIQLDDDDGQAPDAEAEPSKVPSEEAEAADVDKALATPAVRKIAKENRIELSRVPATGKAGRVLKEDVLAYLQTKAETTATTTTTKSSDQPASSSVPRKYAKHMWKSMTRALTIPHFVYSDECDATKLVKVRAEVKKAFESHGLKLSYMPFFLKAISRALLAFPQLNGWIDEHSESVQIKHEHNISLAMDTPGGLVVPNIKNVQHLSVFDVAKQLNRLQELGKKSSIPLDDLTGGTFSISNIGIVGGTYTKPVILSPQIVIGAVGKIQKLPRFDEQGNVVAADILTVSWAADHRVVDGVQMAKFSNLWKHYVENPAHLIVGA